MARLKTENEQVETGEQNVASVDETAVQGVKDNNTDKKAETSKGNTTDVKAIPAYADKLLKCMPQYKELYVGAHGSMFVKDTKPELLDGAILYKNPYYKQ